MDALFFCFGVPKSGTTWLQTVLDAHPRLSCPSEHQFDFFLQELPRLFNAYNQIIQNVDARTARQGAARFHNEDAHHLLREIIRLAAHRGAGQRPVSGYGLKDNAIIKKVPFYHALFPGARFICIVRDPRDVVVSSWHHNQRVEKNFQERAGTLEQWAATMSEIWRTELQSVLEARRGGVRDIHFCRYEDLKRDTDATLKELFLFLRVESDPELLADIRRRTDFDHLAEKGKNPFYRRGRAGDWRQSLSESVVARIEKGIEPLMERFGYEGDDRSEKVVKPS